MGTPLLSRPHAFERGEHVYLTTPLVLGTPSAEQVEEFAFASAVKSKAPNENIGWLAGKYVESDRANLNGAMWLSDEIALKSLTPMLCPVTVMHDPRTAVGCIADCKLFSENASSRLETVLGIWRHRFPAIWEEAAENIGRGELAQSMECYAPWYSCATCEKSYVKLPQGAERASWCECLRSGDSRRILRDTCFTGTGLIFGSRGGLPAYTEAQLDHFQDEVAEYHDRAHADSTYRPTPRSTSAMTLVQIEDTELATLRRERDEAKAQVAALSDEKRDLTSKVEKAEADKVAAETAKATVDQELKAAKDETAASKLKDARLSKLGTGFMAALGETSKTVLAKLASTVSDEDWEAAVAEREELAKVERDAVAAAGAPAPAAGAPAPAPGTETAFSVEELANFVGSGVTAPAGGSAPPAPDGQSSVRTLAKTFRKPAKASA